MHVFEQLLSAIAPHHCIACGADGAPLCLPCRQSLPRPPECCYKCGGRGRAGLCGGCRRTSALRAICVRTLYAGLAAEALHQLKFGRNRAMADSLAMTMADICTKGCLIPLPTANRRVRQRGYDQAELLARSLARLNDGSLCRLLGRQGATRQLGQTRKIRQQQLKNTFYINAKSLPFTTPLVLIDDVLTTGSTVEMAAQLLRRSGYINISATVFAWTPPAKAWAAAQHY